MWIKILRIKECCINKIQKYYIPLISSIMWCVLLFPEREVPNKIQSSVFWWTRLKSSSFNYVNLWARLYGVISKRIQIKLNEVFYSNFYFKTSNLCRIFSNSFRKSIQYILRKNYLQFFLEKDPKNNLRVCISGEASLALHTGHTQFEWSSMPKT